MKLARPQVLWWLLAAAVVIVSGLALWAWSSRGAPVQVQLVQRRAIAQTLVATGRLAAPARIDVGAEITATVREVRVREGERVKAGDVLLRLADDEPRAALAQAQAALAEAQANAAQQDRVSSPVAAHTLAQAESAWDVAQRDYARARQLVAQGFFPQQKLDESRRVLDAARSARDAARVQLAAQQGGGAQRQLAASRVQQAQAALAAAQARLARTVLAAPADALVLTRTAEPGAMAQPGKPLLTLAAGPLRIEAGVDEKHLRLLQPGMAARAVADAYPGERFNAVLERIAPGVDAQRGTVDVYLAVREPPAFARPDMTVSVELLAGEKPSALVLPAGAVRDAQTDAPWVLVLQDGRAQRVPVTLGLRGVGVVEVASGLAEGDAVIAPTEKALQGSRARAAPAPAARASFEVQRGMIE